MAGQPVPVEACEGWMNPCSFCEKKFSSWIPIEEEDAVSTVPPESGAFMFAFDSKRGKEIVAIGIHKANIHKLIIPHLRDLRRQISQKKLKETKAGILLRYIILQDLGGKDACTIYTHWQNYGILPRLTTQWPGLEILKKSEDFEFCEDIQKWCYPIKDPVWRKQKVISGPQAVPKCKGWFQNCSYCDSKFTVWLPLEEAANRKENDGGPPERLGFCMYGANKQGRRKIVHITTGQSIRKNISINGSWITYIIKDNKELEPGSVPEVRWMTVNDLQEADSNLMYAHFLNSGRDLLSSHKLPGLDILENSENFIFRQRDKQWCYDESQASQTKKVSKVKERRAMLRTMLEDLNS